MQAPEEKYESIKNNPFVVSEHSTEASLNQLEEIEKLKQQIEEIKKYVYIVFQDVNKSIAEIKNQQQKEKEKSCYERLHTSTLLTMLTSNTSGSCLHIQEKIQQLGNKLKELTKEMRVLNNNTNILINIGQLLEEKTKGA